MKILKALSFLAFFFFTSVLLAQVPEDEVRRYVKIELTNGDEAFGFVKEQTSTKITIETKDGEIRIIPFKLIESWEQVDAAKAVEESNFYNVQSSRYFITGNAIGIKKGEGYYRNGWVLFNEATFGVTDFFSISGGLIPVVFFGETNIPYWFSPKIHLPIVEDKLYAGAGVLIGGVTGVASVSGLSGIAYGNVTFGNRDYNATLLGGYAFSEGESERVPALGISAMFRLAPSFYLITENYVIEDSGLFSIGGRSIWSGISLDYGLFMPPEVEVALPWLGIMVPFN